jgi:hypothetical protein
MDKKYLPVLLSLFLLAIGTAYAEGFFEVRDLFNNIACNVVCVIEYMILAICAVTVVLSGARYMASDDPKVRGDMRRNFKYAFVGLILVFAGIPAINALVNQTRSPLYCVSCSPDAQVFKYVAETLSCRIICLTQLVAGTILVLITIFAGLRYMITGDDPKARHEALTWLKSALVGIFIIIFAVPAINYLAEGTGTPLECECFPNGDITEQIVTALGNLLCILSLIVPPICALVVTYGGLRYITSADDPGARDTAKKTIISAFIGMILVMLAVPLVNMVLTNSFTQVTPNNNCLQGSTVGEITQIMCNFWCFFSNISPAVCALVVIYGALRYLASGDDPRARKTAKTVIVSAFIGLVLVLISIPIVNAILTNAFGQVGCDCLESDSVRQVVEILCKFICLIATLAPGIAALIIIIGGLRYLTSAEDPEARNAAKTIIISAFVGLIIVMISLALVNLIISNGATNVQCGCFSFISPPTHDVTPRPVVTECVTACAGKNHQCADTAPAGYSPATAGDSWCSSTQNPGINRAHCYCEDVIPGQRTPVLDFLPAESSTYATIGTSGGIILKYRATDFPTGSAITYSAGTLLSAVRALPDSTTSSTQALEASYTCTAEGEAKVTITIKTASRDYSDDRTVTCGQSIVNTLDIVLVPIGYNYPAEKADFERFGNMLKQNWLDETPFKNCPNNVVYHFLENCNAAKAPADACNIDGVFSAIKACAIAVPEGRIYDKIQGVYKGDLGDACKSDMSGIGNLGSEYSVVSSLYHRKENGKGRFAFNTNDLSEVPNLDNGVISARFASMFSAQGLTPPDSTSRIDDKLYVGTPTEETNTRWVSYLRGADKGTMYSILKNDNHLSVYLGERRFMFTLKGKEEANLDSGRLSPEAESRFRGITVQAGSQSQTFVAPTSIRKVGGNWEADYSINGKSGVYTLVKDGGKIAAYLNECDIDIFVDNYPSVGTHELAHNFNLCTGNHCTKDAQGNPTYHCSKDSCMMSPSGTWNVYFIPPTCNAQLTYEAEHFCSDCMNDLKAQLTAASYLTGCST